MSKGTGNERVRELPESELVLPVETVLLRVTLLLRCVW